jgi:hypothetical protein
MFSFISASIKMKSSQCHFMRRKLTTPSTNSMTELLTSSGINCKTIGPVVVQKDSKVLLPVQQSFLNGVARKFRIQQIENKDHPRKFPHNIKII